MGFKSALSKPFAKSVAKKLRLEANNAAELQRDQFLSLVRTAQNTTFGKDHYFKDIQLPADFQEAVGVNDYEDLKPYILRAVDGEADMLWPGKPVYFCKTSGTTSGMKYIPLTKESVPFHISAARNALLSYIAETGNAQFVDGKMIFLQGSPKLEDLASGIPFGRLSGIVAHHVPGYLQKNRLPSMATNSIEDWETKLDAIVDETVNENMTLISGIPSWVQMYFERLIERTGKTHIKDIFPNFSLFVYGGVNFEPYSARFVDLVGKQIPAIETYPASEGFVAYQDTQNEEGLLLNFNAGMWYEFIPVDQYFSDNPQRLTLDEVEVGVNYALIMNTNAGLWGYSIGDTVRFVSLDPPRVKVTGRIKHFTSAFGEHVIAEEVEQAMTTACAEMKCSVREFHVAPEVAPKEGLPYHEWIVEFEQLPSSMENFASILDREMCKQNVYYRDLITGSVLRTAILSSVQKGSFEEMMRQRGKLGGQNKVPRLGNDRSIADLVINAR